MSRPSHGWIERIVEWSSLHCRALLLVVSICCMAGYWAMLGMRMDALPELGDTQAILYSHWDRAPDLIEDQITYPLVTALLGTQGVKNVRGISDFGYSYVYVVFDSHTDSTLARSRVESVLAILRPHLPEDAAIELSPDATSLGWIYQYALIDTTGRRDLAELRSIQDWTLRYALRAVPGVVDVAPVGGFVREVQVAINPNRLLTYRVSLREVLDAVKQSNLETSARTLELSGAEYMVRGQGLVHSLDDLRSTVIRANKDGSVLRLSDLATVAYGPAQRRGVTDFNGQGEVVSGIVIQRVGENALEVTERVKKRLESISSTLPGGVSIVPVYDRSLLILKALQTSRRIVMEVLLTITIIIVLFLWHPSSAIVPLLTMPAAALIAMIPLRLLGIQINIMTLGGLTIAFGELIDASIVVSEQTCKRLELWEALGRRGSRRTIVTDALREIARPTFFSLMVIAVSSLPILALPGQEGQLFRPLAIARIAAIAAAALLAITFDPALRTLLAWVPEVQWRYARLNNLLRRIFGGRILPEDQHPLNRSLIRIYEPAVLWTLNHKATVLVATLLLMVATLPVFLHLGSEFLPPMQEETLLYMPSSTPGISIAQAQAVLQATDRVLKQFPEVDQVLGKAGRAETATDPAPLSMFETLITLRPHAQWRRVPTWYSAWSPEWLKPAFRWITPDTLSADELTAQMNEALHVPGFVNSWTAPIRGRLEMLATGFKAPVGLRISGNDAAQLEPIGRRIEALLRRVPGTSDVFAERNNNGYYIDVDWQREELARYGIRLADAQQVLSTAIGGEEAGTVIDGSARYAITVRYPRDYRSDLDAIGNVLVSSESGREVAIRDIAQLHLRQDPAMIRDENGEKTAYVYLHLTGRDAGTYITQADSLLRKELKLPEGFTVTWDGEALTMQQANHRLTQVVPAALAAVFVLLLLNTRSLAHTTLVMLAVPFSAIGAVWYLALLHYNLSGAVWVGVIALLSIDAETGVYMLFYLDLATREASASGRLNNKQDLRNAILAGAARRLRPKLMTFLTTCIGLFPVMWSTDPGSEVMKHIAAPMVGGIFTSFLLELLVYPSLYEIWHRRSSMPRASTVRMETVTARP